MRRSRASLCAVLLAAASPVASLVTGVATDARAQSCTGADVATVVNETGARLRQLNQQTQPRIRAQLRELGVKQGWSEGDTEVRGLELLQDDELGRLDAQAGDLLARLDQLGDESQPQTSACARVDDARTVSAQLLEVTRARSAHVAARLDAALQPAAAAPAPRAERPAAKSSPPAPAVAAAPRPAAPRAAPQPSPGWDAQTTREAEPSPAPNPAATDGQQRPIDPGDLGFTPEDIRAAGRGFFGTTSAGLASVIDYAFGQFGKPTGYVLGNEGGGAFFAGLRYGSGLLVTKRHGERKIYWQGPSVGYDFGAAGSRVMFLVYNIDEPEEMHARFAGLDGSAYLVGGVGITVLKKGKLILAPIRTGLGLRFGASVGYLKFTPELSINPF